MHGERRAMGEKGLNKDGREMKEISPLELITRVSSKEEGKGGRQPEFFDH